MFHRNASIALLLLAAILEAGGDDAVRKALHISTPRVRLQLFTADALVLFAYGYAVYAPAWNFGRLLGLYVVSFL